MRVKRPKLFFKPHSLCDSVTLSSRALRSWRSHGICNKNMLPSSSLHTEVSSLWGSDEAGYLLVLDRRYIMSTRFSSVDEAFGRTRWFHAILPVCNSWRIGGKTTATLLIVNKFIHESFSEATVTVHETYSETHQPAISYTCLTNRWAHGYG